MTMIHLKYWERDEREGWVCEGYLTGQPLCGQEVGPEDVFSTLKAHDDDRICPQCLEVDRQKKAAQIRHVPWYRDLFGFIIATDDYSVFAKTALAFVTVVSVLAVALILYLAWTLTGMFGVTVPIMLTGWVLYSIWKGWGSAWGRRKP